MSKFTSVLTLSFIIIIVILAVATATSGIDAAAVWPKVPQFSLLGMDLDIQLQDDNSTLEIIFSSRENSGYLSIGWCEAAMTGHIIACSYPTAASPTAVCKDVAGNGYDADGTTSTTTLVSSNYSNGKAMVVVRNSLSQLGVPVGAARVAFARGEWEDGSPDDHGSNWGHALVDVRAGTALVGDRETPWLYLTFGCAWIATILLALIGGALKSIHQKKGRGVTYTLQTITWLCLAGIFVGVVLEGHAEFKKSQNFGAVGRALGAGSCYCFSVLLLPTTKYLNIGYLAGSSYDRFVSFHVFGGIFTCVVVFAHLIYFAVVLNRAEGGNFPGMIFNAEDGVQNCLAAFVGFIFFGIFTIIALLRSYFYTLFRVSHFFFPVIIICFSIHYPPLAVCISPSLIIYIIDVIMRLQGLPQIDSIAVDQESKVVHLVVRFDDPGEQAKWRHAHAGQFATFSIPELSELPHPFTFAKRSRDGKYLHFYIRASGKSTNELFEQCKDENKLAAFKNKAAFRTFAGPMGNPEIDIQHPTDIVLVGGGIGVTATLGLLFTLAERCESSYNSSNNNNNERKSGDTVNVIAGGAEEPETAVEAAANAQNKTAVCPPATGDGKLPNCKTISFVWCLREPSLAKMILPLIEECAKKIMNDAVNQIAFQALIFITQKGATAESTGLSSADATIHFTFGRRPGESDLAPLETRKDGDVAYFSCGPEAMMTQASTVASTHNALKHEEVFAF